MNAMTQPSALAAQALDFRSIAVDLAAQLQQASRSAVLLADELAQAERVVSILIKYMPAAQMIHARLEIDEATSGSTSSNERATWSTQKWAKHVGATEDEAGLIQFGSWMAVHAMLLQFQAMTVRELAGTGSKAALDVLAERRRQVEQEGWTPENDDAHEGGELAEAAMCYADPAAHCQLGIPQPWPWVADEWKPRDRRRNLVRSAALLIAEIERFDRAAEGPAT